jgi:hypothetical protein
LPIRESWHTYGQTAIQNHKMKVNFCGVIPVKARPTGVE